VLAIAIVGGISGYIEKYLTTSVSQWVAHDLRLLLYQRIQRLSLAEHGKSRTGDLITRVTKDIDAVQDFIESALLGIVVSVLTLVGMIGVMLYVNWRFTLIGLSVAPVLFLFVYFYSRRIKDASRAVKRKETELLSSVAEVFTAIQVVQAFAREDYEDRRFNSESRENVHAGLQARSVKAKLADGRRDRCAGHLSRPCPACTWDQRCPQHWRVDRVLMYLKRPTSRSTSRR
jgi:subfamily B ATP-binding cassette protein MsbA